MRVNVFSDPHRTEVEVKHRMNHYFVTVTEDGMRIYGLVPVEHVDTGTTMDRRLLWSDMREDVQQHASEPPRLRRPARPNMSLEEEAATRGFTVNSESV